MEALRVIGLQSGTGRRRAKFRNVVRIVPMKDHERIARLRVSIKALGHENVRADEYVAPPESRQQFAADADVSGVLGMRFLRDRRHFLIENQRSSDGVRRIDMQANGCRIQVAGLLRPLLALTLVGWELQNASIGHVKGFIAIQHRLDQVVAGGNDRETPSGPTEGVVIENYSTSGGQAVDVEAEDVRARKRLVGPPVRGRRAGQ